MVVRSSGAPFGSDSQSDQQSNHKKTPGGGPGVVASQGVDAARATLPRLQAALPLPAPPRMSPTRASHRSGLRRRGSRTAPPDSGAPVRTGRERQASSTAGGPPDPPLPRGEGRGEGIRTSGIPSPLSSPGGRGTSGSLRHRPIRRETTGGADRIRSTAGSGGCGSSWVGPPLRSVPRKRNKPGRRPGLGEGIRWFHAARATPSPSEVRVRREPGRGGRGQGGQWAGACAATLRFLHPSTYTMRGRCQAACRHFLLSDAPPHPSNSFSDSRTGRGQSPCFTRDLRDRLRLRRRFVGLAYLPLLPLCSPDRAVLQGRHSASFRSQSG